MQHIFQVTSTRASSFIHPAQISDLINDLYRSGAHFTAAYPA